MTLSSESVDVSASVLSMFSSESASVSSSVVSVSTPSMLQQLTSTHHRSPQLCPRQSQPRPRQTCA
eukprot:COSAG06_NODE_69665_length_196_cov_96.567010_1_plen_65_part_11